MQRNFILKGDKTTSGGVVLEGVAADFNNGIPIAYHGAPVYCPACKSEGHIAGVGPSWPTTFDGQQVALENDLCICGCNPPPRLIASANDMFMTFESNQLAQMGFGAGSAGSTADQWNYIAFKVKDQGSLEGLSCVAHFDDGSTSTGSFDAKNVVRFDNPSGKVCQRVTLASQASDSSGTFADAFFATLTD